MSARLQVSVRRNAHDERFDELFGIEARDAFHERYVMAAFAPQWYSVLVTLGSAAFHSAFEPRSIGGTKLFDVEPLLGYAGPLVNDRDPEFIRVALEAYRTECRRLGIVAELVRFDPLLRNDADFEGQQAIDVRTAKQVVVVACPDDEAAIQAQFSPACRRRLERGRSELCFRELDRESELSRFRELYEGSIRRVGGDSRWLFDDRLYEHVARTDAFCTYGVYEGDELKAASLVVHHPKGSHYVLAANAAELRPGAGELLIYGIARESGRRGIGKLMLGGGVGSRSDDGLLRYKRKFAQATVDFRIGKIVHDPERFRGLCAAAEARDPSLAASPFFLKYRR